MKLSAFLKDKSLLLLLHLSCMLLLAGFLHITCYPSANIILIGIFWLFILGTWLSAAFLRRRTYFREAAQILENPDTRYLLGEMLPTSSALEDQLYREMLRRSNKSVIEKIRSLEDQQKEYREYLESWVHEIKTPITGISLLCENRKKQPAAPNPKETADRILLENGRIENCVDMVLYYARSEQVYKDYLIREVNLQEIIYEALEKERLLLIRNRIQAEVSCEEKVCTDRKWILFIINQLILNSVKYRGSAPVLRFYTLRDKNSIVLTIEDNGTGIRPEDLPRIFEKGFTGTNGRSHERATGMGLYLCQKLCGRLGIRISVQSEYGKGTKMLLTFPVSSYIVRGQDSPCLSKM